MTRLDRTNAVHHVYRCYDESGRLIYVGSSANLFGRLEQHRRASWWAGQVAKVTAKVYPTGTVAREFERKAIRDEAPRWNKAGRLNTQHSWTRDQYDDWLHMLIKRGSYPHEIRRFVDLYRRTWSADPSAVHLAALEVMEDKRATEAAEWAKKREEARVRLEEIEREDELGLRRERKAARAKAKRLAKKAKRAKAIVREYDEAIES